MLQTVRSSNYFAPTPGCDTSNLVADQLVRAAPAAGSDSSNFVADQLVSILRDLLEKLESPKEDAARMVACLKELGHVSQKLGPDWKVRAFGSVGSGFRTRFSDLDVTCYQEVENPVAASVSIGVLLPTMEEHSSFKVVEVISSARIPILKLCFDGKLDVDVSFQNVDPLRNTQLLRAYARLSTQVRQLVALVKFWARAEGVCGAQYGHLSSYSVTLMAIYFLQVDPSIQMPCFPTSQCSGDTSIPKACNVNWKCPFTVPLLIRRFFEFYASEHWWGYEVISIRTGKRLYASDAVYNQLKGHETSGTLQIEDPFLLHRNLNCVLGTEQHTLLYNKIVAASRAIQLGMTPFGFMTALSLCEEKIMSREAQARSSVGSDERTPPNTDGSASTVQDDEARRKDRSSVGTDEKTLPNTDSSASTVQDDEARRKDKLKMVQAQGMREDSSCIENEDHCKAPSEKSLSLGRSAHKVQKEDTKTVLRAERHPRDVHCAPPSPEDVPMTGLCQAITWAL